MTVYFATMVSDPSLIKIGTTSDLPGRMLAISASFDGGVELLAQCDGGTDVEKALHALLDESRVEGEWFRRTPTLEAMIAIYAPNVTGRRVWGRAVDISAPGNALERDRDLARQAVRDLAGRCGAVSKARALESVFLVLRNINPLWSRRRVRALWEGAARRIDHFEMRDLEAAKHMTNHEWAMATAPAQSEKE